MENIVNIVNIVKIMNIKIILSYVYVYVFTIHGS